MSGFFKNKNLVISISLVLIVVLIILSMDVYSRNSLDKNGKQLGYYDTFRNVFGFSPIVENADEVLDTVKETVKDTINDIVDDIKLPKLVPVTPKTEISSNISTSIPSITEPITKEPQIIDNVSNSTYTPLPSLNNEAPIPKKIKKKEVFNVDNNSFTYNQAKAICKAYDSELATYDQLVNAHRNGANWCNYGWSANNLALYPIQDDFYQSLSDTKFKNSCGKPGINGGYFKDENLKFGVNCYGYRPEPDEDKISYNHDDEFSLMELDKELQKNKDLEDEYRRKIKDGTFEVRPFSNNKWSRYSHKKSKYILTPKYNFDELEEDYEESEDDLSDELDHDPRKLKNNEMDNEMDDILASQNSIYSDSDNKGDLLAKNNKTELNREDLKDPLSKMLDVSEMNKYNDTTSGDVL